jgi:hypothetical protein
MSSVPKPSNEHQNPSEQQPPTPSGPIPVID